MDPQPCPFMMLTLNHRGQQVLRFDNGFGDDHGIPRGPQGRTQGLVYSSYGVDVMDAGDLNSRRRALVSSGWQ